MANETRLEVRGTSLPRETSPPFPSGPSEGEIATELVRRIAAGDPGAESGLVERYGESLLALLRRLGLAIDSAHDLRQEAFRIVLERLRRGRLADPERLAGFLHGTVRRLAVAERRKIQRRRSAGGDEGMEESQDPAPDPLQVVLAREERRQLGQLIRRLPVDRDRQLLRRVYVAEEDRDRICADLGLDRLHLNRILFRARRRFRELVEAPSTSPPRRR